MNMTLKLSICCHICSATQNLYISKSNRMKEIKVKSNGIRNELKEIRNSIDALTRAILLTQTNQHEKTYTYTALHNDAGLHGTTEDGKTRTI